MEQGTLGELYLTRSVTKHIRKYNKAVAVGAGVGKDYALVDCGKANAVNVSSVVSDRAATANLSEVADTLAGVDDVYIAISEGHAETPYIAWVKALNNLAMSGGRVSGVRVCYMLPTDTTEEQLKAYAGRFNDLADSFGLQIIGGNTRISSAYSRASFLVEAVGTLAACNRLSLKAKEGYEIVMVGYTAVLGTNLMVDERREELNGRFAPSYVAGSRFSDAECCILSKAKMSMEQAEDAEIVYMHDISHGGVYGALWQLGQALNMGVAVNHRSIPVKQETIELCNYFDINPYMLEGTGAFLVVAKDGKLLADALSKAGCMASVVGRLTKNKERVVLLGSGGIDVQVVDLSKEDAGRINSGAGVSSVEKRFLTPVKGDEIYKVISAY